MLEKIFPFVSWFRESTRDTVQRDLLSGLTVALVLIPQSMAYAQLAGLPVYYGLYASFLPPMIASMFGSSRQLATGPVAVVSLMTSASLEPLATAGSPGYIAYAILLALMVGVFQFSLGILRLGIVVNFLSHPVVNGFTNAAAIIIASSQLSKMFGVFVDKADHHYETIFRVCQAAWHYTHWPTFFMGALAFGIMYSLKKIAPKIPNVLVAVAVTTVLSWAIGFENNAVVRFEDFEDNQYQQLITDFNRVIEERNGLGEERATLSSELNTEELAEKQLERMELEHRIAVINVKLGELGKKEHTIRDKLRAVLFSRFPGRENEAWRFVPYDASKEVSGNDGHLWRLKVGNKKLELDSLNMIGGGSVVGVIPKGLPALAFPKLEFGILMHLIGYAAIISLLGFMEAISIAKAMAAKTGQRLDPNQELIGQGLANIIGSMGKSYPTSGSFSRSAVNLQAGAFSGLSSVVTSVTVVIVLLFFTPLLYYLPQSVLAAVIMMAVIGLINVSGFIHAWQAQWYDGAISILTFICTLAFAPHLDRGIMVGVVLSLGVFLYKSMRPTVRALARHEDESLRSAVKHGLKECDYIDLVSFDGPLFFANASFLEDTINDRLQQKEHLQHIILVCYAINDIDASGEEVLSLLIDYVRSAGVDISLCGVNEAVSAVLHRTHLLAKIGEDHIYATMERAICAVHEKTHTDSTEEVCPLTNVCRVS